MTLRPPNWPGSILGEIDEPLANAGQALFDRNCANCHQVLKRTDLKSRVKVQVSLFDGTGKSNSTGEKLPPPGTDPWMACNAYDYSSQSGVLEGFPSAYFAGDHIPKTAHLSDLLTVTVAGSLFGKKSVVIKEAVATAASEFFRIPRPPVIAGSPAFVAANKLRSPEKVARLKRCLTQSSASLGYASRPLNGILATAPYLHNGSVPTLYDLLLPPENRPREFYVGTRQFDPERVGYVTDKETKKADTGETQNTGNTFLFSLVSRIYG